MLTQARWLGSGCSVETAISDAANADDSFFHRNPLRAPGFHTSRHATKHFLRRHEDAQAFGLNKWIQSRHLHPEVRKEEGGSSLSEGELNTQRKIAAPKTPEEYFQKTEHAVKHLYAGLESCWSYYREALEHWDPIARLGEPITPESTAAAKRYVELAHKYFGLKFSEATFAGAILQVAYTGIRLFSRQTSPPSSCENLIRSDHGKPVEAALPFCVGEEHYGIPVGLIIYAARNQYNHWDEEQSNLVTRNVFRNLTAAFYNSVWSDLAFDLSNPTINLYADQVLLAALAWTTYDKYLNGMNSMLSQP